MDVGIGLPAAIPGVSGASAIKWAQKAETGPFADEQLETMKRIWAGGAAGERDAHREVHRAGGGDGD